MDCNVRHCTIKELLFNAPKEEKKKKAMKASHSTSKSPRVPGDDA